MADILLNEDGDISISNGLISLTKTIQEDTAQRLSIKIKIFLGEWYLDFNIGIPYFETIFQKSTPKNIIDTIFRSAILEDEQVSSITSFESAINDREYSLSFTAVSNSGEIINLSEQITF